MEQLVIGLFLVLFTLEFIVESVLNELNLATFVPIGPQAISQILSRQR